MPLHVAAGVFLLSRPDMVMEVAIPLPFFFFP